MKNLIFILFIITSPFCNAQRKDAIMYLSTDNPPKFEKSKFKIDELIHQNIIWPKEIDAEGTVIVSFIVTKKGEITDIRIERSFLKEFDEEAIRVLKSLPKWIPGRKNGKKVEA